MKFASKSTIARQDTGTAELNPAPRWVLASLALPMLLSSLGTSIANVGLPALARVFDTSFQNVQWIVLAYLLAITTLIVGVGRLGDVLGRRRLMLIGVSVFTIASVLCGVVPMFWLLVAARAAQGFGAAILMALSLALVGESVPKQRIGSAMGLLGTMSAIGTALGPTLGGVLIAGFGWRAIFLINLPLGLLAFALAYRYLPADRQTPSARRARFDYPGMLLLALTLAVYALAMTMARDHFDKFNAALLALVVLGAAVFLRVESRSASPLIPLVAFRNPLLSAGFAMSAMVTTVLMATLVVGPFYLSGALALDIAQVGFVMSCGPIVAALTGLPAGRLVDRFGAQTITVAGLVGITMGCVLLSMLPARFGIAAYVAPIMLITAAYALFQAANNTTVMSQVRMDQRGVVSGVLNLSRNLGLITGASAMGAVFAFAARSTDIGTANPEAVARGMQMTFGVAATLSMLAIAIALGSRRLARRTEPAATAL